MSDNALTDGDFRRILGFEPGLTDQEPVVVRTNPSNSTTTYATTYGRGSTGTYGDLTTSYPYEKPADKGQTGSDGSPRTHRTYRYESVGRRFESCRARSQKPCKSRDFVSLPSRCFSRNWPKYHRLYHRVAPKRRFRSPPMGPSASCSCDQIFPSLAFSRPRRGGRRHRR